MPSETKALEDRLDTLLESTEDIRSEIKKENAKHDVRIRTNRRATVAAVLVGLMGVFVGFRGVQVGNDAARSAHHANAIATQTNVVLTTSRKASCDNAVKDALKSRSGAKKEIRVLVRALADGSAQTPELAARIKRFYVIYDAEVDTDNPIRDCSPAGIAKTLKLPTPTTTTP